MSTWTLIQVVFNIFIACGLFVVVMRMNRAPKDDPRLSRGLALLQSKISVLEDLSDRTEAQVTQLVSVLESKAREVQAKVELADRHVNEIRVTMERSLEVASIFQDKIPHKEIIERQNTIKYVQAARLAHSGATIDAIAAQVDLPRGEVEFIASVNRDRLMFTESELPEWARTAPETLAIADGASGLRAFEGAVNALAFSDASASTNSNEAGGVTGEDQAKRLRAEIELAENQRLVENLSRLQFEMQNLDQQLARDGQGRNYQDAFDVPKVETDHLKKLGDEFRKAVREGEINDAKVPFAFATSAAQQFGQTLNQTVGQVSRSILPPLENLSSLIPNILEAGLEAASPAAGSATAPAPIAEPMRMSAYAAQLAAQQTGNVPTSAGQTATTRASMTQSPAPNSSQRAAAHATPTEAPAPKDPLLSRAMAQAKVQAALRSTARPVQLAKPNPELTKARAVARDMAGNVVSPAKPGEVRKVMFPRIDGSEV